LIKIREGVEWDNLDITKRRVINLKIRDAELAGVHLSGESKKRFNEISTKLSKLGHNFSNNVLDSTKAYEIIILEKDDTNGWPKTLLQLGSLSYNQEKKTNISTPEEGPWRLTLEAPILFPFLRHNKNRDNREKMLKAYVSRADSGDWDNKPLIKKILQLRKEMAGLLDYNNYADMSLTAKMAPSVEAVKDMFNDLFNAAKPHQLNEFNELDKIAKEGNHKEALEHWDIAFWSERLKEKRFDLNEDELRPYFPLTKVLEGMFGLTEFLFGVKIKEVDGDEPVWDPYVRYFKVYEDEAQIGSFYLDAYSRPEEKRGGAWMDNCLVRRKLNNKIRLPVVYLNANVTPPIGEKPSLLSFEEVKTLFHEFGHGLQGMLTKINHSAVSGINGVEWDAVEIISQFMENWCYHEPTMRLISDHWETNEKLPYKYVKNLREARVFRAASAMIRQLMLGMTDMELHSSFDPFSDEPPFDVYMRIAEKTQVLPPLKEDHLLCAFNHIFAGGYAAGYYSYKWAEVLSTDIFSEFQKVGFENEGEIKELGLKLRETFLALGGSVEPMKIFRDFMGREPSTTALLKLNNLL
jgi:oligopeptidase A